MYAEGLPAEVRLKAVTRYGRLPFVFEASGSETHFTNGYDPQPRARRLFAFPQPGRHQRRCRRRGDRKSGVRPGRRCPSPFEQVPSTGGLHSVEDPHQLPQISAGHPSRVTNCAQRRNPFRWPFPPMSSTRTDLVDDGEPGERSRPDSGYTGRAYPSSTRQSRASAAAPTAAEECLGDGVHRAASSPDAGMSGRWTGGAQSLQRPL
jgi:hypothetical protein